MVWSSQHPECQPSAIDTNRYPIALLLGLRDAGVVSELSTKDYNVLLDLAVEVVEQFDQRGSPWQVLFERLSTTLNASIVGILEVRSPQGTLRSETWPPWTRRIRFDQPCLVTAHPLVRHYTTHTDSTPRTISEVINHQQWLRSPVYERAQSDMDGASYQLAAPLDGPPGTFRSLALARPDRDFDDRDRLFMRRLQPLMASIDRRTARMQTRYAALAAGAATSAGRAQLTRREAAVLALLADGLTAQAIGHRLGITTYTVSKHQQNVYQKLNTHDRLTTVLLARELGLLPDLFGAPKASS